MEKRNGNIDFWRFIFSLVMVCFHMRGRIFGGGYFQLGYLAVDFFFIVSGIMMAASSSKYLSNSFSVGKNTVAFMKKKVLNLMPNYYIAWIIAFSVIHIQECSGKEEIYLDLQKSLGELLLLRMAGVRGYFSNGPTWYLSAMLLAMLILFPLLLRYKENFYYIVAPTGFIFLFGLLYRNFNTIAVDSVMGIFDVQFLRAIMDILLGCVCYHISQLIKEKHFSTMATIFLSVCEVGILGLSVFIMVFSKNKEYDWELLWLFAIGLTISYSQRSVISKVFAHKIWNWLGVFSYNLYLGHWAVTICVRKMQCTANICSIIYLVGCVLSALFIMYLSKLLRTLFINKVRITS